MVDLSSAGDPYKIQYPNSIFIIPGLIVFGLFALFGYKLYKTLVGRELKKQEKQKAKLEKKNKKKN